MVIGDLKKVKKRRSDGNRNIIVISDVTEYADINNLGEAWGELLEKTILTGDCLKLDHVTSGGAHYFSVYTKEGAKYLLDKRQRLYIELSPNSWSELSFSKDATEEEYNEVLRQVRVRKINAALE